MQSRTGRTAIDQTVGARSTAGWFLSVVTSGEDSLIRSTLRALLAPRRAIPILLVSAPLVVVQAHWSHPGSAPWLGIAMCGAFVVVAPISWRVLFPEGIDLRHGMIRVLIFCTAYAEHAVQAFAEGAVDYLLKPVEVARLQKALDRARLQRQGHNSHPHELERLAVPTRQGIVLLHPREISHAELGDDELVTIHTTSAAYLTDFSLQELEKKLPRSFERVHRRVLLNLESVARLEPTETGGFVARTHSGQTVIVSRQAARNLRNRLGLR